MLKHSHNTKQQTDPLELVIAYTLHKLQIASASLEQWHRELAMLAHTHRNQTNYKLKCKAPFDSSSLDAGSVADFFGAGGGFGRLGPKAAGVTAALDLNCDAVH